MTQHAAHLWLTPRENSFWRWANRGGEIEWVDGRTIAFREEIAKTLYRLRPHGFASLDWIVLLLAAVTGLCALWMPAPDAWLLASGIAFGYVAYGIGHFMIHHRRFRHPLLRKWAARHHIHHHHPERNFGVTSPLWDAVLGTRYVPLRSTSSASARSARDTSTR